MDKKELISKIINKLKKFKKNKLIDIYNNFISNIKENKGGFKPTRDTLRIRRDKHRQKDKIQNRSSTFISGQYPEPSVTTLTQQPIQTTTTNHKGVTFKSPTNIPTTPNTFDTKQNTSFTKYFSSTIKFKKINTKFYNFDKSVKFHDKYDKDITYQHTQDAFKIFTVLKHMYKYSSKEQYLTDTVQIFQTLDNYYIKDVLEFVKNYLDKEERKFIFKYIIKNNKIFFKLNKFNGIMLYTKALNTLDIYLKKKNEEQFKGFMTTQEIPFLNTKPNPILKPKDDETQLLNALLTNIPKKKTKPNFKTGSLD